MADRFCEPGLYGNAVVVCNTTYNNATLTVTSVTSGRLGIGARITGPNIPDPTFISSLGTGRGGAGTYTMSRNATATQAGITVTAEQGNPALDPDWNVAQDGDGLAKDAATPATAKIVFTGTPSGTISVCGVTVSPTWGSGADAAANGLATAINAATGNVTTTSYNSGVQLRNAVWARGPSAGAPSGTCEIMTRQGSALHNGLVCIAHTLTNVNAGSSSLSFSGGASGAWGWLLNGFSSIWPSGIGRGNYGLWCSNQVFVGSQSGHTVHIRADVPRISVSQATTCTPDASVSPSASVRTINTVDDGTHWPSSLNARLEIETSATGGAFGFTARYLENFTIRGTKRPSDGKYTLLINEISTSTYAPGFTLGGGLFENIEIVCAGTSSSPTLSTGGHNDSRGQRAVARNIRMAFGGSQPVFTLFGQTYETLVYAENIVLDNAGAVVPHNGLFSTGGNNGNEIFFRGLTCKNFVPGSKLCSLGSVGSGRQQITIESADLGNVAILGPNLAQSQARDYHSLISVFGHSGSRDFYIESLAGMAEWNALLGYPTLNATLLDGVTKWSVRMLPNTVAGWNTPYAPLRSPRFSKINSLPTGQRTISVEVCISDQLSWTKANISLEIIYRDVNGDLVTLSSYDPNGGALTASAVTWTQEVGGKPSFVSGSTVYHNKFRLSVTTPTGKNLPEGEEVAANVFINTSVGNSSQLVFVDPDITVA